MTLNEIAEQYVKLVLSIGLHDAHYVDAYYGPAEWATMAHRAPLNELAILADRLITHFENLPVAPSEQRIRQDFLLIQLKATRAFIDQLSGQMISFDEESLVLYDAISPRISEHDLDIPLKELDQLLPGNGNLNERLNAYQRHFEIPQDKLKRVFTAAINEARLRTNKFIDLPKHESFDITYVQDKVWSAYNWYQGNSHSLIEVNTDFPMPINRAIDLACHEGYPGHHVFNLLMEKHLVQNKGWIEYCIYPLYSPMSLLAEGSANYGICITFNENERLQFEKFTLFPLAGIDPDKADNFYKIQAVLQKLSYAGNLVAQRFVDGEINEGDAVKLLMKYTLADEKKSTQRINFIKKNRSYVINYNLGEDIVKKYIEHAAGDGDEAQRWKIFSELLMAPMSASMMQADAINSTN